MKKIVYLPLDERPCNYNYVSFLAQDNKDVQVVCPSLQQLGNKKTPAQYEVLQDFLLTECKDADYLICSIDMLLYGGIIPSRLHHLDEQTLTCRLQLLNKLKQQNSKLNIYAFSLIMRCPTYTSDDEEPSYYGICGHEIFLYGQNEHKYSLGMIGEQEYLQNKQSLAVCFPYIDDFTSRRAVNVNMVLKTLLLVGNTIDYFIIPQDDSNPFGYTALDQAKVKKLIASNNIDVDIYPGADEVGMTLLSKVFTQINNYSPKVCPIYPNEECKNVIPLFEDREVYKSIAFQIKNAGATLCDEKDADILLFCNLPVGQMHNVNKPEGEQYDKRNLPQFVCRMAQAINSGKAVAVADIAYSNGGDVKLTQLITNQIGLLNLYGYAGWNTSSNTLGTVLCQSIVRYFYGDTATHRRFTALRIYEDICYDSAVRWHVWENEVQQMGFSYEQTDGLRGKVNARITQLLIQYTEENYPEIANKYKIADSYLPWNRMFEIGLVIKEK